MNRVTRCNIVKNTVLSTSGITRAGSAMIMSKKEILDDMLAKYEAYVSDWKDVHKWDAYVEAWKKWREVKGDD